MSGNYFFLFSNVPNDYFFANNRQDAPLGLFQGWLMNEACSEAAKSKIIAEFYPN